LGALAAGAAGVGVAALAGASAVASSEITSAFTSLRTLSAAMRAISACDRAAYGPTRTRQAGLPPMVASWRKASSPDWRRRSITMSASAALA
jgi:hypothetical protein